MRKNIFVLGSEGVIGKRLKVLLSEYFEISCYDLALGHDLTDKETVEQIFKTKPCDGLVNLFAMNEHVGKDGFTTSYEEFSIDEISRYMQVNIVALFEVCRTYVKYNNVGSVVNYSSIYGVRPPDNRLYDAGAMKSIGYSVSKSAVVPLTEYFAKNISGNVRFNVIAPGGVRAEGQNKDFVDRYSKRVPLGRMCEVDDLIGPTKFLLSDESKYVNGVLLPVDGGFTL